MAGCHPTLRVMTLHAPGTHRPAGDIGHLKNTAPVPRGLQRIKLGFIVRRAYVLDVPRPAPRGPHDLTATAAAPVAVLTVRTDATRRDYEP